MFVGLVLLSSCDGNYQKVKVFGTVVSSVSQKPVSNQLLNVTCWVYDTEIWESRKVLKTISTDERGNYEVLFDKGEAIDIEVSSSSFKDYEKSLTLTKSNNEINIKLQSK